MRTMNDAKPGDKVRLIHDGIVGDERANTCLIEGLTLGCLYTVFSVHFSPPERHIVVEEGRYALHLSIGYFELEVI